jgi:glycine/D-amino acid oxidase-like deaminating enzyme/nitrite reductase/ring-hydroxylating ferredoxin subunit
MQRDGINPSLWQQGADFTPEPISLIPSGYDVLIVGGGMTGVVTALTLQKKGRRCLLVESHNLGFGTTGGTTAHLNTLLDTPYSVIAKNFGSDSARVVHSAVANAIDTMEDNISTYNIACDFEWAPAYLFSQDEKETSELEDIFTASLEAGLNVEYTQELPIPVPFEKCLVASGQAKFHPLRYLFALAGEFEKLGGHILLNCRVEKVSASDDELLVETSRGNIMARKVVYATHIPPGVNILHLRCAPWRSYAMALKLNTSYPAGLIYDMKDPYHYYRTQVMDGEPYLVVGGKDHKTGDEENTNKSFLQLRAHIEKIFDVKEITHHWSSQYFEPADGLPYIGLLPGYAENVYVGTGYGGNGMVYSHVAAREISNLILTGESLYENLFSPSRIKPIAGFNNFVGHNADVVKHYAGKFFGIEQLEELAGIAPGEGKVVKFEGSLLAISKEDNGELHAVASSCTHMKCNVVWNNAEHSWDCPCHGARYSPDGTVLTGPANHDLEPIAITKSEGQLS